MRHVGFGLDDAASDQHFKRSVDHARPIGACQGGFLAHHSRPSGAVLITAVATVAEQPSRGSSGLLSGRLTVAWGARQRPRQSGLRARHWESAAARARPRPA